MKYYKKIERTSIGECIEGTGCVIFAGPGKDGKLTSAVASFGDKNQKWCFARIVDLRTETDIMLPSLVREEIGVFYGWMLVYDDNGCPIKLNAPMIEVCRDRHGSYVILQHKTDVLCSGPDNIWLWRRQNQPFAFGGKNRNIGAKINIRGFEIRDLGKGFKGIFISNGPAAGVYELVSGGLVGDDPEQVMADIEACEDIEFMKKQVDDAKLEGEHAEIVSDVAFLGFESASLEKEFDMPDPEPESKNGDSAMYLTAVFEKPEDLMASDLESVVLKTFADGTQLEIGWKDASVFRSDTGSNAFTMHCSELTINGRPCRYDPGYAHAQIYAANIDKVVWKGESRNVPRIISLVINIGGTVETFNADCVNTKVAD